MRLLALLLCAALTACAHRVESGDMDSGTANIFMHEIQHIGAAP